MIYLCDFTCFDDVCAEFHVAPEVLKDARILLAYYLYEDYNGDAFVFYEENGKLYEVNGGHCSCFGLEDQWEPEETTVDALRHRLTVGRMLDACPKEKATLLAVLDQL